MNHLLRKEANKILLSLLSDCTDKEQEMFKRMYGTLEQDIVCIVKNMNDDKIDWAITQCENTVKKKSLS